VGQGLLLPTVIRWLGLAQAGDQERQADRLEEYNARRQAIEAVLERIDRLAEERKLADDVVKPARAHHRDRLRHIKHSSDGDDDHRQRTELDDELALLLIEAEREHINRLSRAGELKDEARRRIERELDLREASIANRRGED
jgi:monovalent cation/hydrogen antiporter